MQATFKMIGATMLRTFQVFNTWVVNVVFPFIKEQFTRFAGWVKTVMFPWIWKRLERLGAWMIATAIPWLWEKALWAMGKILTFLLAQLELLFAFAVDVMVGKYGRTVSLFSIGSLLFVIGFWVGSYPIAAIGFLLMFGGAMSFIGKLPPFIK